MNKARAFSRCILAVALTACIESPTAPNAKRLTDDPASSGGLPTMSAMGTADTTKKVGAFNGLAGHEAGGTVTVEFREGGLAVVTLGADFTASRVPDPQLYLNTEGNPNRGMPIRFSRLDAFKGTQRYVVQLPANAPAYTHVLLWCDHYNQGVGAALIKRYN